MSAPADIERTERYSECAILLGTCTIRDHRDSRTPFTSWLALEVKRQLVPWSRPQLECGGRPFPHLILVLKTVISSRTLSLKSNGRHHLVHEQDRGKICHFQRPLRSSNRDREEITVSSPSCARQLSDVCRARPPNAKLRKLIRFRFRAAATRAKTYLIMRDIVPS